MKYIYALQMDAENFNWEDYMDEDTLVSSNIWIGGNRDYTELNSRMGTCLLKACGNVRDDVEYGADRDMAITNFLSDYMPDDKTFTDAENEQILKLVEDLAGYDHVGYSNIDTVCALLQLLTGIEFKNGTIHGCCQGDWANYIAPKDTNMSYYEAIYFGTGTEWRIAMEETESEPDWDEIECYHDYTDSYKDADVKEWIAKNVGNISAEQVKLIKISKSYLVRKYEYEIV